MEYLFFQQSELIQLKLLEEFQVVFFAKKGKLIAVIKIKAPCKTEEIIKLLFTLSYLCFNGSDINATLVKPEPDNKPIISSTLP